MQNFELKKIAIEYQDAVIERGNAESAYANWQRFYARLGEHNGKLHARIQQAHQRFERARRALREAMGCHHTEGV